MNSKKIQDTEKIYVSEQNDANSEEKQNKLLRLLGGKKTGNVSAAAEWMQKSRSAEDEQNLKQGLEAQYNASLNLRLSGKTRRHEGIGFEQQIPVSTENQQSESTAKKDESARCNKTVRHHSARDRSRSPLRKNEKDSDKECSRNALNKNDSAKSSDVVHKSNCLTKPISKKNFYMQFTKSSDS